MSRLVISPTESYVEFVEASDVKFTVDLFIFSLFTVSLSPKAHNNLNNIATVIYRGKSVSDVR